MSLLRLTAPLAILAFSAPAFAQDECMTWFTHPEWKTEMDNIDKSLAAFNLDDARLEIDATWRHVGCLHEVVDPGYLARFMRQRAMLAFFDQDEDSAIKWGLAADYTAPDYPWSVPEDHPFRAMIADAEDPPIGGVDNGFLLIPKGGALLMDGAPLLEPKARAEVPAFMQVVDKKGIVVTSFWQDGAAFPQDLITTEGAAPTCPLWFKPWTSDSYAAAGGDQGFPPAEGTAPREFVCTGITDGPGPKGPKQPGEGLAIGIPQLAIGGGLAVLSGVTYGIAGINAGKLDNEDATTDDMVKARSTANVMVLTSAILGVGAIGVGATAFVNADGGVGGSVRVRF